MSGIGPISGGLAPEADAVFPVAGQYATPSRSALAEMAPTGIGFGWFTWLPIGGPGTIDMVGIEVTAGVASSIYRVGLYAAGANGKPGALLVDGGTVDCSGTGLVAATVSQPVSAPGVWLCAFHQGAGSPTIRINTSASGHWARFTRDTGTVVTQYNLQCWSNGTVSGALPATAAGLTLIGDTTPAVIVVRFA